MSTRCPAAITLCHVVANRGKQHHRPVPTLGDHELLALLTGNRRVSASRVRDAVLFNPDLLDVVQRDEYALQHDIGLPPSGARRLAAAVELHRRLAVATRPPRPTLQTPEKVVALMATAASADVESFWCLALDSKSRLIGGPIQTSLGDIDGTDAGPRAFFRPALRRAAISVIAVHNHPSGEPDPSTADRSVTRRLATAGRLLDVELVDHVILGHAGRFTSLRRDCPQLFSSTH